MRTIQTSSPLVRSLVSMLLWGPLSTSDNVGNSASVPWKARATARVLTWDRAFEGGNERLIFGLSQAARSQRDARPAARGEDCGLPRYGGPFPRAPVDCDRQRCCGLFRGASAAC